MQQHKHISIASDSNFMYLTQENAELKDKAEDRPHIKTQLEAASLKSKNE